MNLLLDTHALIWFADNDAKLSRNALALIADPTNDLYLSMATAWELAIKSGIGKLSLSPNYRDYLNKAIDDYDIKFLDITFDDCTHYEALPFPNPQHRDPYDRMIVVHALRNSMNIVSIDDKFDD